MTYLRSIVSTAMLGLLFGSAPVHGQLSREEVDKIREAAPASSTVKPKQDRLLLVFNRSEGYRHRSVPYAAMALEILGKKTGAYETVVSEDLAMFLPENLKRFDAVCLNNTTQLKFEDPLLRKSLLDFIASGKGIIGIHAATDNFPTWSEGQELLGGVFDGHPWTSDGTWQVKIEDPTHPLNDAFAGKDFLIKDEIYRVRQINLRKNSRVLLGLDMKAERNSAANGLRSTDRDIPISWVRTYGKGRLFYCSLGHNDSVYTNAAVLKHYLGGIQFALGDFQVDTTPVAFNAMSFFNQSKLTELLNRVSVYQYGESRAALTELNTFIRGVDDIPEARERMEVEFLDFLKGSGTLAGKQFMCTKLALIGSEASVGQLSTMLSDTATADMALFALEPIWGSAVDAALVQALKRVDGPTLIGVIAALGNRRVIRATSELETLATHSDSRVALSAVSAMGRIGTPASLDGLGRLMDSSRGELRTSIFDAMLSSADRLRAEGDMSRALAAYKLLIQSGNPTPVRCASLRGIVLSDPHHGAKTIQETLRSGDTSLHGTAAKLLTEIPDIAAARSIASDISLVPVAAQVQILSSLALYPDVTVQKAVAGATASKYPEVRIAALRTVGMMADAGAVLLLARAAARSKGKEQNEARESLYALHAAGVDDSILACLGRVESKIQVELLKAIAARRFDVPQTGRATKEASGEVHRESAMFFGIPLVLKGARDLSAVVRLESVRTLKVLAGADEIPEMIDLLLASRDESFRREMVLSIAAAARRIPPSQDEAVLKAYPRVKGKQTRILLINLFGKIAGVASLPVLRETLKDRDSEIRMEAIRALSAWPTSEPYGDLWTLAQGAKEPAEQILAFRGTVHLIRLDSTRSADETIRRYQDAMRVAPGVPERRMLLSALAETHSVPALRMAADYLSDKDLHSEAEAAMLNIAEAIPDSTRRETVPLVEKIIASSSDTNNVQKASTLLASIERYDDYITAWEYAGPFVKVGAHLLDAPFSPELASGARVPWLPLRTVTDQKNPWLLEFDKLFSGEDMVIYFRTNVWSPAEGNVRLEVGSNYGVKVWWNERLVHTNNTMRSIAAGSDIVPTLLKKGWNTLMMKLEQGESPWGACIRLRAADSRRQEGIRVSTVQN